MDDQPRHPVGQRDQVKQKPPVAVDVGGLGKCMILLRVQQFQQRQVSVVVQIIRCDDDGDGDNDGLIYGGEAKTAQVVVGERDSEKEC